MRGRVLAWRDGTLVIRRTFSPGGTYDSLNLPKRAGDWGTIEVIAGGWVLRRVYRRADGSVIGELYNIQTPAELGPDYVHYTDLEVDVVRFPSGRIEVVDESDLQAAVEMGGIPPELAEKALAIARRLVTILREGGDWRAADRPYRPGAAR
jgi:hypothetical protein